MTDNTAVTQYLREFREAAVAAGLPDRTPGQNWYALPLVKGSHISLSVGRNQIQVNLNNDTDEDRLRFNALWSDREAIQKELDEQLVWDNKEGRKKTAVRATQELGYEDTSSWPNQHKWAIATIKKFQTCFGRRIV